MAFSYGLKRQVVDKRDGEFRLLAPWRALSNLPDHFTLPFFSQIPMLDQGNFRSCGPTSFAEYTCYDELADRIKRPSIASRMFVYYNTRKIQGDIGFDDGVSNRDMFKAVARFGYVFEDEWSYTERNLLTIPPTSVYHDALREKGFIYHSVPLNDTQLRGIICTHQLPLMFGFDVFPQMQSDKANETGIVDDPKPGATPEGGHDVLLGAYDLHGFGKMNSPAWKFRNHWVMPDGRPWGDNGCGYISAKYVTSNHASDAWALNATPQKPVV